MTRTEAFAAAAGSVSIVRHSATSYAIYGPFDPMKPEGATTSAQRGSFRDAQRYASGWKAYVACRLLDVANEAAIEVDNEIRESRDTLAWREMVRKTVAQESKQ